MKPEELMAGNAILTGPLAGVPEDAQKIALV